MISIRMGASICGIALLSAMALVPPSRAAVSISLGATTNMTCTNGICTPTASDAVLNAGDLEALLASGNVEVTTTGAGIQAGDIRVETSLGWSASSTLALDAYESVVVDGPVAISGQGGLSVTTNDDGGSGGDLSFEKKGHVTFASLSSSLAINATTYTLLATLPALRSAIAANPSGAYALSSSYDASANGPYRASPIATTFTGSFEGLGNTISRLKINGQQSVKNIGLFADVDTSGSIASLRLTKVDIATDKDLEIGALAAISDGSVFNSSVQGTINVNAKSYANVGGLVAANDGTIRDSAAEVDVVIGSTGHHPDVAAGGLVGASAGRILESFATGSVMETGPALTDLGGLVGISDGIVEDCFASGAATEQGAPVGNPTVVGGLAGQNDMTIENSYSTGAPTGGAGSFVGGLIGDNSSEKGAASDTYWDTTTSGITNLSQGSGNIANDPGIAGLTTQQLQAGLPAGFDPTIWAENPRINGGLPYLIVNPPPKM